MTYDTLYFWCPSHQCGAKFELGFDFQVKQEGIPEGEQGIVQAHYHPVKGWELWQSYRAIDILWREDGGFTSVHNARNEADEKTWIIAEYADPVTASIKGIDVESFPEILTD